MNLSLKDSYLNCTTPFDSPEFDKVAIVKIAAGCLSFLVGSLVITFIIVVKKWNFFSERLILYLTITAIPFSLASILNRVDFNDSSSPFLTGFCIFGGFLTQVSSWMTLNAITAITLYLFGRTVLNKNTEKYEWVYLVFIFVVPLLFNWIPFIYTSYGRAGVWCWIRSFDLDTCKVHLFGQWLQFGLLFIPLYVILLGLILLYVLIFTKTWHRRRQLQGKQDNPHSTKLIKKITNELLMLVAYPFIYFILCIPLLLNRIHTSVKPTQPNLLLWYLSALSHPMVGAFTGMAFILHTAICRKLTWTRLRAQTRGMTNKVSEYPMRPDEVSDSIIFSEVHANHHADIGYNEY